MNTHQWYLMGLNKTAVNTFIGGVAATIGTKELLASKLAIDVSRISNFSVMGSDIKCGISGTYAMPPYCFETNMETTYFKDKGACVSCSVGVFQNGSAINNNLKNVELPFVVSFFGQESFRRRSGGLKVLYIPISTQLGESVGFNNFFEHSTFSVGSIIYAHPSLATNNAGSEDGDIAYARSVGATIRYVTNFDKPSYITNLTSGTTTATTIQLNFTHPTGTNAIEYYEVWINGVDSEKTVTSSGQNITGLITATNYNIKLKAVDIFYNKSEFSNVINATTL